MQESTAVIKGKKMFNFICKATKALIRRFAWIVFACFPIKKGKIVVSSYYGRGYGDNPKYIVEELLKQCPDCSIIWLVKDEKTNDLPERVKKCLITSPLAIYHLATAKVWIDNCRKSFMFKKKRQVYIQTWHGFALKRIERDVSEHLSPQYVKQAIKDSKHIDYIVSCSDFMTNIYKKSFWYDGEVVQAGAPRNDIIINGCTEIVRDVKSAFSVPDRKKIVLYAPTFRANGGLEAYGIDYSRLKQSCEQRFGGEFVVIVRLHPNILNKSQELNFDGENIINGSYYSDMQELLVASDVVISDYSSLMFDFALSSKPCFQFATDIEDYKSDRNFYFKMDSLPFSIATNNDELESVISCFDHSLYSEKLEAFWRSVGMNREGNASRLCTKLIIDNL